MANPLDLAAHKRLLLAIWGSGVALGLAVGLHLGGLL